ncbi:CAP domain-containing protein [Bernardetia sp. ABR2-2B]|uniref:CAP domain-containing protein n=1 Tax=Bernardetia sp. ABR2-2B TaxID=3127472 RepID=UPI0030CFBB21
MNYQNARLHFLSVFLLFGIFACAEVDEEIAPNENNPNNVNKQELIRLVNEYRTEGCQCGNEQMLPVGAITWDEALEQAAYLHSKDMNDKNYFSHTGKDGSSAGDRIKRQGYDWRTYGENIAEGYTSEEAVIEGWKNSEGHCRNMMNANFEEMGVGRESNYWTQVFGAK